MFDEIPKTQIVKPVKSMVNKKNIFKAIFYFKKLFFKI